MTRTAVGLAITAIASVGSLAAPAVSRAAPMTFTVDTSSDSLDARPGDRLCATADGACSLRAAIDEANRHLGADAIRFAIPGGAPQRIRLTGGKLVVNQPDLSIDGYTEPGARTNDDPVVSNALPGIEIVGNGGAAKEALEIATSGTTVRGLAFNSMFKAVWLTRGATGNTVAGNLFGLTAAGAPVPHSGYAGVLLDGGAHANRIGTPTLDGRNVIDNAVEGITLNDPGSDANMIQNNLIGISPDGAKAYGNSDNGVDHNYGSKDTLVGGTGPMEGNVISGNRNDGVEVSHGWNPSRPPRADQSTPFRLVGNRILGNIIGFRPDGRYDASFRNGNCYPSCAADNGQGVNLVDGASQTIVRGNWIIGARSAIQISGAASVGNTIEQNFLGISPTGAVGRIARRGISLHGAATRNLIARNTIDGNRDAAIAMDDAATYANHLSQNSIRSRSAPAVDLFPTGVVNVNGARLAGERYPIILTATRRLVSGVAPAGSLVELFSAAGAAGFFGPGRTYLRTARATSQGRFRIRVSLRRGVVVTAASYGRGGSSEFGPNVAVPGARFSPVRAHLQDAFGTCLGVHNGSSKAGTRAITAGCASSTQKWLFAADGTIRAFAGSRCLAPAGGARRQLAHVVVTRCRTDGSQRWTRRPRGWIQTGAFCLDARSGAAGTPVRLTRCSDRPEKVWPLTT